MPNIPSAVARTASHAVNNALLPYIQRIADSGFERAIATDSALARGVGLVRGAPFTPHMAAALESAAAPLEREV